MGDTSTLPAVGIDLGTTNSVVATVVDGVPRIIERRDGGQRLLPSMVGFTPGGDRVVGEKARFLAENFPEDVAYATKRFMGLRWTPELAAKARTMFPFPLVAGPQEDVRVKLGGRTLPVVQVAAMILTELRLDAEAFFGRPVRHAVITVPANFNDAQRQATQEAARIAGLEVLRLINEPTAAALAYGSAQALEGKALVFDLGGGTFDVSVLEMREGVYEVVATGGDSSLGGEDFDNVIVQWLIAQVPDAPTRDRVAHDRGALQRLKVAAEQAKCAISTTEQARISCVLMPDLRGAGLTIESMLVRPFFERIAEPKARQCLDIVDRTLAEAKLEPSSIARVLLVGGMTRVPIIRRLIAERFGREPATDLNPDEVVAAGAAIHAAELVHKVGNVLLVDVVSSSLGVGIAGGGCRHLIKKNSSLPCRVCEVFHPSHDLQTTVRIPVMQGESNRAADNFALGELTLEHLRKGPRGEVAIEVTFEMGTDGVLSVQARDKVTGRSESARILARRDLQQAEVDRLAAKEAEHRSQAKVVAPQERERTIRVRALLRERIEAMRSLHRELSLAASETGDTYARDAVEALGRKIVEAEGLERSGTPEQVETVTGELDAMERSLAG